MPQCPICKAAVWAGQRYCSTCDNYLPHPEEADHFCPRCGIRAAPQQEICHKCKGTLTQLADTPAVTANSWRRSPGILIFLATGLAIVALVWLFLSHQQPRPPQLLVTPPPQAASKQTPAAIPVPPAETAPSAPTAQEPSVPLEPATPSTPKVTTPIPSPPLYLVNVHSLALRDGPTMSAPQIATLNFQDEVELLDTAGAWGKVRDEQRNLLGWVSRRYLQPVAAGGPRTVP